MTFLRAGVALTLLSAAVAAPAQDNAPSPAFTADAMKAHVAFLSDDLLKGRDTGSEGHEIAARYVASRFAALGLKPAGDNGSWYQTVPFQQTERTDTPATVDFTTPAGTKSWTHGTTVLVSMNPNDPKLDMTAPIVFVGYGIENAKLGLNDYAGLNVKGKIVVTLRGYPKGLPSEEGAHAGASKALAAQSHGAVGLVSIDTIQSAKTRPWAQQLHFASSPAFSWVGADGKVFDEAPGIRAKAMLDDAAAQALFSGARRSLNSIRKEADRKGATPKGFALTGSLRIQSPSRSTRITSPNVAAILPGSDPKLAAEYVVLSAHLDHIGVAAAKDGDAAGKDRINNGALDNAAGIATMLEVARAAAEAPAKPRRSLLFIASTAEERGLLGADYYARHPTVPAKAMIGNIDLDMPLLLYPFTDVIAFGANHSTLGPIVSKAVAPMGVTLSPDPMPQEGIFTRSDHYMFVKQGVPAVFLATGYANGGEKAWKDFLGGDYHHPGDDMSQKIDWQAGARFAEANYRITRAIADADTPPLWYRGDFFGDTFAPEAAKAAQ